MTVCYKNNVVILHQNIRSLRKNVDVFLADLITSSNLPSIIVLTETWVNSSEIDFYNIPNYFSISNIAQEVLLFL